MNNFMQNTSFSISNRCGKIRISLDIEPVRYTWSAHWYIICLLQVIPYILKDASITFKWSHDYPNDIDANIKDTANISYESTINYSYQKNTAQAVHI